MLANALTEGRIWAILVSMRARAWVQGWVLVAACTGGSGSEGGTTEGGEGSSSGTTAFGEGTSTGDTGVDTTAEDTSGGTEGCALWVAEDGADADACGTEGAPCRTLSTAITLAEAGCTIRLGPGTYSPATGEQPPWELPTDVHLIGSGSDLDGTFSLLDDGMGASSSTFDVVCDEEADPLRSALVMHGGRVEELVVRGIDEVGYATVLVLDGTNELERLRVESGREGIFVAGTSEATITDCTVTEAGHAAVKPAGDSVVEVVGATLIDSKDALEPICRATTTVRNTQAYCNGNGLEALDRAHTTMIDNDVHHNINGIAARGQTQIVMTGNTIHDNAFGVVDIFGRLEASSNVIQNNIYAGMMLNNVESDTMAVGNLWEPMVDGADDSGGYSGMVTITGPVCGANNTEIEAPIPEDCDPRTPWVQDPSYQNYALNDGSCASPPSCGDAMNPCMPIGTLVLSQ